jgi:hypothetical protein
MAFIREEKMKVITQKYRHTTKHRILLELMTHGEAPLHHLMKPEIGGTSADRRLRELREAGFDIDFYYKPGKDGRRTKTTVYVLKTPIKKIDFRNLEVLFK